MTNNISAYLAIMKQRILEYLDALGIAIISDLFTVHTRLT